MVKCESLRINMLRITHTGKSVNFPVTDWALLGIATVALFNYLGNIVASAKGGV